MLSLLVHALLGVTVVVWVVRSNPAVFRRVASGPQLSTLEIALYLVGLVSIGFGWYFNIRFVREYGPGGFASNPLWGDGSWAQYLHLMFANPAAGSAGADFTIANVVLLPLITIVDGRRRGLARPWLYFASTLFASFTFGWAFYLATVERQRRLAAQSVSDVPAPARAR
jgi:hypothetical protein